MLNSNLIHNISLGDTALLSQYMHEVFSLIRNSGAVIKKEGEEIDTMKITGYSQSLVISDSLPGEYFQIVVYSLRPK